jgi:SAM-dependent methyltransferase
VAELSEHASLWDESWDWSQGGDEWSRWWGGTPALWHGALLPRIHPFVPAGTILEIAPGFGRWTQFLKDLCERLVVVDLAERCIEHCRRRFADATNIEYHRNDGRSLAMVADGSVDFAFSFDSLVHADADVLDSYLGELARTLAPDGVGFIHHSNLGAYRTLTRLTHRTPALIRAPLIRRGALIDIGAWRDEDVTAVEFAAACERAGLACFAQETIRWERGPWLTDALSLITPRGSRWERPHRLVRNRGFGREARRMAALYAAG